MASASPLSKMIPGVSSNQDLSKSLIHCTADQVWQKAQQLQTGIDTCLTHCLPNILPKVLVAIIQEYCRVWLLNDIDPSWHAPWTRQQKHIVVLWSSIQLDASDDARRDASTSSFSNRFLRWRCFISDKCHLNHKKGQFEFHVNEFLDSCHAMMRSESPEVHRKITREINSMQRWVQTVPTSLMMEIISLFTCEYGQMIQDENTKLFDTNLSTLTRSNLVTQGAIRVHEMIKGIYSVLARDSDSAESISTLFEWLQTFASYCSLPDSISLEMIQQC